MTTVVLTVSGIKLCSVLRKKSTPPATLAIVYVLVCWHPQLKAGIPDGKVLTYILQVLLKDVEAFLS